MGTNQVTAEQMATYLLTNNTTPKLNCTVWELVNFYLSEGKDEGIRGDIAFCQSIRETGWFSFPKPSDPSRAENTIVKYTMNNFCGLGATGVDTPCSFDTPQIGVRAQIQHLLSYASTSLPKKTIVDPRFYLVSPRGIAIKWIDLKGRWATDSSYQNLLLRYDELRKVVSKSDLVTKSKTKIPF